jgi:type IV secretion system protein VirD4
MPDIKTFPRGVPGRDPYVSTPPSAEWAVPEDIAANRQWQFVPGDQQKPGTGGQVFLGQVGHQLLGIKDNRHIMTIAGSRAGKGVSAIIPNLIEYPGSILVIDPKGENAARTASRRSHGSQYVKEGLGQKVFVLDPFGRSGHATSRFNPLDMIKPDSDTAIDDASLIAEGLVIPREGENSHWSDSARNFLRGLILYVCVAPSKHRDLPRLRRLLTLNRQMFGLPAAERAGRDGEELSPKGLLHSMIEQGEACHGIIRRAADTLLAKADEERSGVISTAIEQTGFLDSPKMAGVLKGASDFDLKDLKRERMTVYLCLPAGRMVTHNRWLRIMINLAVQAMEDEPAVPDFPVLFIMDEFAVLDHMTTVERAAGQIAGFHVRLWPILQDLPQLQSIYDKRWETFMGNAGILQFFGNNDLTTLEYLSKRLGKCTITELHQAKVDKFEKARNKDAGRSEQPREMDLMSPDEIGRYFSRQSKAQLLLCAGEAPIAIDRVEYWDNHPFFAGKFDPLKKVRE